MHMDFDSHLTVQHCISRAVLIKGLTISCVNYSYTAVYDTW